MTTILKIPVHSVLENKSQTLDLMPGTRCSRCDTFPAVFFETHFVKYEAGLVNNRRITKNFRTSARVSLRLPLCESCYQKNFTEDPDTCRNDGNSFARIARWRKLGINFGSVFAGVAFVLLMKVIPLPESVPWLKFLWMILVLIAMGIYAVTFGLVELKNRRLLEQLRAKKFDFSLRRAEVFAVRQMEDPEPDDVAVTVALKNDAWANECAGQHGWSCDVLDK